MMDLPISVLNAEKHQFFFIHQQEYGIEKKCISTLEAEYCHLVDTTHIAICLPFHQQNKPWSELLGNADQDLSESAFRTALELTEYTRVQ